VSSPLIDPKPLWDFDDPAGSQSRLQDAADASTGAVKAAWLTQVARALGLREEYVAAHALLDSIRGAANPVDPEVAVRLDLERGRLFRSAGDSVAALPLFESAAARANRAGLEELHLDALHMAALAAPSEQQLARNQSALAAARASTDDAARNWDASILNNIGMVHADAGDFAAALPVFEEALAARERIGDVARTRIAKWMVAWTLRELGRTSEALERQRALKAELDAAGESDPYVDQELAILEGRSTE
jgi:tetratricopeptide (TPR) repeat protein